MNQWTKWINSHFNIKLQTKLDYAKAKGVILGHVAQMGVIGPNGLKPALDDKE